MKSARILTVAVAVLALGLAACAEATPAPTTNAIPTSSKSEGTSTKADLVRDLLTDQGIATSGTDAEMERAGDAACDVLRAAPITSALLFKMATITSDALGVSVYNGGFVVGALIGVYCPEFESAVNVAIGNGGAA